MNTDRFIPVNREHLLLMYQQSKYYKITKNMIITTTPTIEGHTIKEYKGLVSGEVIFGM